MAKILRHPRVYSFLHVPIQSASDAILGLMKREYNCEDFCSIVDLLRREVRRHARRAVPLPGELRPRSALFFTSSA
jgi:tRNA A37 methylthiotransferase MiaB